MHVIESIKIILMLLSYVMQKTGRLTFEEKCKMLSFVGELIKHTDFVPCISDKEYSSLSENQLPSTTKNILTLGDIDVSTTIDQLRPQQ